MWIRVTSQDNGEEFGINMDFIPVTRPLSEHGCELRGEDEGLYTTNEKVTESIDEIFEKMAISAELKQKLLVLKETNDG